VGSHPGNTKTKPRSSPLKAKRFKISGNYQKGVRLPAQVTEDPESNIKRNKKLKAKRETNNGLPKSPDQDNKM
jgi:hypothetical protein